MFLAFCYYLFRASQHLFGGALDDLGRQHDACAASGFVALFDALDQQIEGIGPEPFDGLADVGDGGFIDVEGFVGCLLYTSDAADEL